MTPAEFIASRSTPVQPVCHRLRELVLEVFGDQQEIVFEGWGNLSYGTGESQADRDLFCYIAPYSKHVNLGFYRGALLPDPEALLTGSGKLLRHIPISTVELITVDPVRELLRAARRERLGREQL